MKASLVLLAGGLALLGACGEREADVARAPPPAPDTRTLGAGPLPGACTLSAQEALQRINVARAQGRRCGGRAMGPAPPLKWDPALQSAASGHSLDMARRNYFDHRSPEGAGPSQRASRSNYDWKSVGENLAGGDPTVAEAIQGWLESPEHCSNLMDPAFADVAVACAEQPGTQWGTYWTMVLGRKR